MFIRDLTHRCLPYVGLCLLAQLLTLSNVRAAEVEGTQIRDPHYGEVLFYFYQQQHFEALSHLVTSEYFGRIDDHAAEAELLRGGLLLSWGQHREAGRIFEALLSQVEDDQSVRDRTWFYIGKVRYQRGYYDEAAAALESIVGTLPPELEAERFSVQASTYMALGRYSEAAALLAGWDSDDIWMQYARFNLGVALVRMGLPGTGRFPTGHCWGPVGPMRPTRSTARP